MAYPNLQKLNLYMEKPRYKKLKFDHDRIVMSGSATGAHETVAFYLANLDYGFLVPTHFPEVSPFHTKYCESILFPNERMNLDTSATKRDFMEGWICDISRSHVMKQEHDEDHCRVKTMMLARFEETDLRL